MRATAQTLANEFLTLGLAREQALAQVAEVAHSRVIEPTEAQNRIQEHIDKWKQSHARALQGQQRESDQGIGW